MKLALSANISSTWSYSIALRDFAIALERAGHDVLLLPDEYLHSPIPVFDYRIKRMLEKSKSDLGERVFIRMSEGNFQHYGGWGAGRIAFTMLETDAIPPSWVEQLNLCDQVWTCSEWGKGVFEDSGVTAPVFVVPLSVDGELFNPDVQTVELGEEAGTFVFFINSSFGARHNVEAALAAYVKEFAYDEPVLLVYHGNMLEHLQKQGTSVSKYLHAIGIVDSITAPRPRILIARHLSGYMPAHYLARLYGRADLHLTTARGHGFNLTSMEAMACGTPTAVTNWSAHTDFVTEENGYLFRVRDMIPAFQDFLVQNYAGSKWADPDVTDIRRIMRHAFEHREELARKGEIARTDFLNKWTWAHSVKKAESALEQLKTGAPA